MHGRKRRSPARFLAGMKSMRDFFQQRKVNAGVDVETTDQGPIAKPVGEDQREYNPKQAELKQKLELDRARIEMSMALSEQKQKYEDYFSKNKGDGSHTHGDKKSMNTGLGSNLGLSYGDAIREVKEEHDGGFKRKMDVELENKFKNMDFSKMAFQTANASPLAKKAGFKMKRKK